MLFRGAGKASEAGTRRGKPSRPRPARRAQPNLGASKTLFLWLMWHLVDPNGILKASPGSFFQIQSHGGAEFQSACQRWVNKIRELGWVGSSLFFLFCLLFFSFCFLFHRMARDGSNSKTATTIGYVLARRCANS